MLALLIQQSSGAAGAGGICDVPVLAAWVTRKEPLPAGVRSLRVSVRSWSQGSSVILEAEITCLR